jgi:hypothetical protein
VAIVAWATSSTTDAAIDAFPTSRSRTRRWPTSRSTGTASRRARSSRVASPI